MYLRNIIVLVLLMIFASCTNEIPSTKLLGKFNVEKDLYLAQFDCKTDADDIHSVAGVKTILNDPRFLKVKYHAVAGAYGIQDGLYVPANEIFEMSFGDHWSDAHTDFEKALDEVSNIAVNTLNGGGNIWIAEAGQSDFSSSLIRNIKNKLPSINTNSRIHIIQHSEWNENQTTPDKLNYVKENSDYIKIPDGNVIGNGSPGFYTEEKVNWEKYITDTKLVRVWEKAFEIADKYNGRDGRHNNPAIAKGGMDFSDVSETCWIFGFNHLENAEEFFKEFTSSNALAGSIFLNQASNMEVPMSEHVTYELLKGLWERSIAMIWIPSWAISQMIASSTCLEAPSLAVTGMSGRTRFAQAWQSDLRGFRMCIMEMISTGSAVISESLNGHLPVRLCQGKKSKFAVLTCSSLPRGRSSARILSGK